MFEDDILSRVKFEYKVWAMVKLADLIYVRQIKVQYKHYLCYVYIFMKGPLTFMVNLKYVSAILNNESTEKITKF